MLPYLRPDGKAQVSVRYEVDDDGRQTPVEIERVLISTQHREGLDPDSMIKPDLIEHVLRPILPKDLYDEKQLDDPDFVYVNPTGKFVIGGPMGDTGLTGRKIIVDTYGGAAPHGGGAFSGKDPTKVDRSAAYAARYVAKNVVAAGLADRCQVQVAYAIGVAQPFSVLVETFGTEKRRTSSGSSSWSASTSTCARRRSCATSTCAGRSTRRQPPTGTSAATTTTSRGSAPTRPTRALPPAALRLARSSNRSAAGRQRALETHDVPALEPVAAPAGLARSRGACAPCVDRRRRRDGDAELARGRLGRAQLDDRRRATSPWS